MIGVNWSAVPAAQWEAWAGEHATPYFLLDADAVAARIGAVRQALQGLVQVYYAVKANPNLGLLRAVRPAADGVDISSGGELQQALAAGFDASRMSFAGPAKTDEELEAAIRADVGCISVESLRELDACARIAAALGKRAGILLRVNPILNIRAFGIKMGGRAVQFGIDEELLPEAEARVLEQRAHLDFRGIHTYVGSQCFEAAGVVEATTNALRIATAIGQRSGLQCSAINLGGGFGISHVLPRRELDLAALGQQLVPVLEAFHRSTPGCTLIYELGRYITADAGIYVTRVISAKTSRGKRFHACDGGLNHQLAAAGTFGAALRGNFPLLNLTRPDAPAVECSLAGPSCNPTDLLAVDAQLAEPHEGDLIGVQMSGSYGLTASPTLFLGHSTPVELVRSQGQVVVGRRAHSMTEFN